MPQALIRESFEIVTYESAEHGDAEERGWIDEDGTEYSLREAYRLLQGTEPSASAFHVGVWYTRNDHDGHPRTGARDNRAFHLTASVPFQRRLFALLTAPRKR